VRNPLDFNAQEGFDIREGVKRESRPSGDRIYIAHPAGGFSSRSDSLGIDAEDLLESPFWMQPEARLAPDCEEAIAAARMASVEVLECVGP
jgi:hypothetical protein